MSLLQIRISLLTLISKILLIEHKESGADVSVAVYDVQAKSPQDGAQTQDMFYTFKLEDGRVNELVY